MTGPILLAVTAFIVGAAWMRVAYVPRHGPLDLDSSYRELSARLAHAIVLTVFLGSLWIIALLVRSAGGAGVM
jgi:hypothetical protein